MGLFDEIQAAGRKVGTMCAVRTIREGLDPDDLTDLDAAIANPTLTGAQIARALSARGHTVKGDTVQRHRKGECACGQSG